MPVSVFPTGTTLYKPEVCANGYCLIQQSVAPQETDLVLIDMNGEAARRWKMDSTRVKGNLPRHRLLPNGHVLVLRNGINKKQDGGVQEYDWDGRLVWEYATPAPLHAHHDVVRTATGGTLIVCTEAIPEAIRRRVSDPRRRERLWGDVIQEISPDGRVAWEWHAHEHLDIERCQNIPASQDWWAGPDNNTVADWTHTNTVQDIPPNRHFDAGDSRFRPGNVLLSMRQLDLVLLIDRATGAVVWEYTGDYHGGMSGQHDAHLIEKGLPGEGNVLIFDNGASPYKNLWHVGASYVLEVDPATDRTVWVYDKGEAFHSNFTSSCQRLGNGNTLILEAAHGRLFEVTPAGETVWEHVFPRKGMRSQRAYRYEYGYCPQFESLPRPAERAVIPQY